MREGLEWGPNVWPWLAATTKTTGFTMSTHPTIIMNKHQRPQMHLSWREADSGRRPAKVAVTERPQIEYHPACQDVRGILEF